MTDLRRTFYEAAPEEPAFIDLLLQAGLGEIKMPALRRRAAQGLS